MARSSKGRPGNGAAATAGTTVLAAVTLQDVADRAGVSAATASRAFNGSKDRKVRAELRDRVLTAAEELGYLANPHAQAVARGRTDIVGLVIHDVADPFFSSIAAGVIAEAEREGLIVTITSTSRDPGREIDHVVSLRRQKARALVIAGSRTADRQALERLETELLAFEAGGGRAALISQRMLPVDTVTLENRSGSKALATELVDLGHQRFAALSTGTKLLTARDRLSGFRDGLVRKGLQIKPDNVVHAEFTREGGYAAMQELIARRADVTCVFAVNDVMALGAAAALREHGLAVGRDVALAGFDDIPTVRDLTPALTTVRVAAEELGRLAIGMVLDEREDGPRVRKVHGEVVIRESTPRPTPGRSLSTALG
jgi:LacI family transcriptional regulator